MPRLPTPILRWLTLALAAVTALAGVVVGGATPAAAAGDYTVQGTVLGHTPTGTAPLANTSVSLYLAPYVGSDGAQYATTDAAGHFAFTVTEPHAFIIRFIANGYAQEYYGNTADINNATAVTVGAAAPSVTADITRATASTVSGRITDENGAPVQGSYVHVHRAGDYNGPQDQTDANGDYTVTGVAEGEFYVEASGPYDATVSEENRKTYYDTFLGASTTEGGATPLTVTPGSSSAAKDIALQLRPATKFHIVDADGNGISGASVLQLTLNPGTGTYEPCQCGDSIGTGSDGWYATYAEGGHSYKYVIMDTRLNPRDHPDTPQTRVENYDTEWWADAPTQGAATVVSFSATSIEQKKLTVELAQHVGGPLYRGGLAITTQAGDPRLRLHAPSPEFSFSPASATFTRRWVRDGQPISDPTGSAYTYTPGAADADTAITLRVTATYGGQSITGESAPYEVPGPALTGGRVSVTGTHRVGSLLSATSTGWAPGPVTTTFQWYADGAAIPGATRPGYRLPASTLGRDLAVRVTATKPGYPTRTLRSAAVSVARGRFSPGVPGISGVVRVGAAVKAKTGTWAPSAGVAYSYRWFYRTSTRGKVHAIAKATNARFRITKSLQGDYLTVRVTATRPGFIATSVLSAARKVAPQ